MLTFTYTYYYPVIYLIIYLFIFGVLNICLSIYSCVFMLDCRHSALVHQPENYSVIVVLSSYLFLLQKPPKEVSRTLQSGRFSGTLQRFEDMVNNLKLQHKNLRFEHAFKCGSCEFVGIRAYKRNSVATHYNKTHEVVNVAGAPALLPARGDPRPCGKHQAES